MEIARNICLVLLVLVSIALITVILMQKGKKAGLGALGGGGSAADTFWSQNKSRSKEGRLDLITKCLFGAFMVLALLIGILS